MPDQQPPPNRLRQVRLLLWALVALAALGAGALLLLRREEPPSGAAQQLQVQSNLGGPFALTGGDGKPFASSRLAGKPYAIFFGFTRCGDVCPTTLGRLVSLREQASGGAEALNIVFVTIDPANDGPKEVGQYAGLFNSPIIGLTGTPAQIDAVKKQFAIHAEPVPHAPAGKEMEHTGSVLLFDRNGDFVTTVASDEPDSAALEKFRRLIV